MKPSINDQIRIYQDCITRNDLHATYKFLLDFMNQLQRNFKNNMASCFTTRNVLNGYLDYTYFYFDNDHLRSLKLKMGIVLNHKKMKFELWLMGSTKPVQLHFWNQFKDTPLNLEADMPQWYVVSVDLVKTPNFEDLSDLSDYIMKQVPLAYDQIVAYL
ncbi:DUF7000 family protein [Erysipelothrix tonsillarum]|uniref:DUF7000 family protein n=1 Tax=Erysipelothrix tonsillarum TaxID=38402 RepID=UPI00037A7FC0|nr:hypothetical protein [Erysipelothrix tonsillarum]